MALRSPMGSLSEQERRMTDLAGVIDRSSSIPFHLQLRKLLEHQIETGQWPQGDRLPSEPFLSEHYGVSRATVRQALARPRGTGAHPEGKRSRGFRQPDLVRLLAPPVGRWALRRRTVSPRRDGRVDGAPGLRRALARLGRRCAAARPWRPGSDLGEAPPSRRGVGALCGEPPP